LTGDEACTSFHCSNKETCSAVRTVEATRQVTHSRIIGEVEMVLCEWLWIQGRDFCHDRIFKYWATRL